MTNNVPSSKKPFNSIMRKAFHILLACVILLQYACTDLSGIEKDIDNLTNRVEQLEDAVIELQTAYNDGKIIKNVAPIKTSQNGGWEITFSDNSSINIYNGDTGEQGITPICQIDEYGYWSTSYNEGVTYTRLLDTEGCPIKARGDEGVSVRVVSNEEENYCIEFYYESNPDSVFNSITTPYTSNGSAIISSIVKDNQSKVITLSMADGSRFNFNLDVVYPTSIVLLSNELMLCPNATSSFEFRVNPSNAFIDLSIDSLFSQVTLDLVNNDVTRSSSKSYTTSPKNYRLTRIECSKTPEGEIKSGQYTAYVEDLGIEEDYSEGVAVVINTKDGSGNDIQVSSSMLNIYWELSSDKIKSFSIDGFETVTKGKNITIKAPYNANVKALKPEFEVSGAKLYVGEKRQRSGRTVNDFSSPIEYRLATALGKEKTYTATVTYSNLPIVYINTPDKTPIISKEEWVRNSTMIIANTENAQHDTTHTEIWIKGRGNSTWPAPKKPYTIKLASKSSILGMPEHSNWVLLANWYDKTCMRNAVAFEIGRKSADIAWSPRGEFVDVVLNGKFLGNYYLCEQIKVGEHRVNIDKINPSDLSGTALTGGYILELDAHFDEINQFRSNYGTYRGEKGLPVIIKHPDEEKLVPEQFEYIKNYFCTAESLLYVNDFPENKSYQEYIDVNSFIDWWFVHELAYNGECINPFSCYMYKNRLGKLTAGPPWDFDLKTFQPNKDHFRCKSAIWYIQLFKDPDFVAAVKSKWISEKSKFEEVLPFIDASAAKVKLSAETNEKLWPYNDSYNGDEKLSFDDAVTRLRNAYAQRIEWMDNAINAL